MPKLADSEISRDQNNSVVEWMEFLDAKSKGVIEMLAEKNKDIKKAYDLLKIISKDEKARMLYEAREAELRDQLTRMKSAENKGREEGEAEGKLLMAQDAICRYLAARLGAESQGLQESVRAIMDLDRLNRIMDRIFIVTNLDEATILIRTSSVSQ
ncbi:PD-(D/E)XK nuclease family transposase [Desulfosporosinus orientis]|uniref:PD-(D/E)XK nuclease family transposase n=1 Tax=Desulfosporosinus orientis TaxID=1563 RepID=UPI001FA7AD38|nr:PD-(D/E)XK nuclease family transposase [Desulfosporosinus orientis]